MHEASEVEALEAAMTQEAEELAEAPHCHVLAPVTAKTHAAVAADADAAADSDVVVAAAAAADVDAAADAVWQQSPTHLLQCQCYPMLLLLLNLMVALLLLLLSLLVALMLMLLMVLMQLHFHLLLSSIPHLCPQGCHAYPSMPLSGLGWLLLQSGFHSLSSGA